MDGKWEGLWSTLGTNEHFWQRNLAAVFVAEEEYMGT